MQNYKKRVVYWTLAILLCCIPAMVVHLQGQGGVSGVPGIGPTATGGSGTGDVTAAASFGTNEAVIVADGTGKGVKASTCTKASGGPLTCSDGFAAGTSGIGVLGLLEGTAPGAGSSAGRHNFYFDSADSLLKSHENSGSVVTYHSNANPQTSLTVSGGVLNATAATTTSPNKTGTSLPGTCAVGESFQKTDATASAQHYLCTSTNTWTSQGGTAPTAATGMGGVSTMPFGLDFSGNMAVVAGGMKLVQINVAVGFVLNKFMFRVNTAVAGETAYFALYNSACDTKLTEASASVASTGAITASTAGDYLVAPGHYWVGVDGSTTSVLVGGAALGTAGSGIAYLGTNNLYTQSNQKVAAGVMPASCGTLSDPVAATAPMVRLGN